MAEMQQAPGDSPAFLSQPVTPEGTLEIDDRDAGSDAGDSTFSEVSSYTTSLITEVTSYRYENGRRYSSDRFGSEYAGGGHSFRPRLRPSHGPVADYVMPNDEQEVERLDICHEMFKRRLNGKLHLAPIGPSPQRVLDIGCGSGIWAIEMGASPTWTAERLRAAC